MKSKPILGFLAVLGTLLVALPAAAQPLQVVALGDSNTAGFGVGRQQAFPAVLEALLRGAGIDAQVSNAGISGDTTAGMLARVDEAVPPGTQLAIVQGGYNDLRRGSNTGAIAANMDAILARLRARGTRAILCGFYGEPWAAIAQRHGALFVPSTACYDAAYRGFDGLHMNATGHQVVASRLLPTVQRFVQQPRRR